MVTYSEFSALLFLMVFFILFYIVIRQRRAENSIVELNRRIDDLNQNLPAKIESVVVKTFQTSAGIFENLFSSAISKNVDVIKGAFATSLKELGIQEDLGKLKEASSDLKAITSDFKSMFQVKHSRAKFGELQLENLLRELFPPNRVLFQKNIGSGIPDACIVVEDGKYLCIDSKFPLENFRRYNEAENESERERYWREFLKDIEKHIEDVKNKYIGKENTLDFAFMFIPSDTIFYHLVSENPEIAVEAAKSGVILTSPSILPAYLSLVSARIQAQEISKRAEEIQKKLGKLSEYINDLGRNLDTLFTHVNRASNKIADVKTSFDNLKSYYSSVFRFEEEAS